MYKLENETIGGGISLPVTECLTTFDADLESSEK